MTKNQTLPDVSYIQKMFNKHNYSIGIRDVHANGDKGYFYLDPQSFAEICVDSNLNPVTVFNILQEKTVYVISNNLVDCEYFILWNDDTSLNYGLSYRI